MPNTYEVIKTTTLGSSSAQIAFTSIPQTFKYLMITYSIRSTVSSYTDDFKLMINSNVESQTYGRMTMGAGIQYYNLDTTEQNVYVNFKPNNAGITTNSSTYSFTTGKIFIPNYSNSTISKSGICVHQRNLINNSTADQYMTGFIAEGTNAITSLYFLTTSGSIETGSSISLYGLKDS